MTTIYHFDKDGIFTGPGQADPDVRDPEHVPVPHNATLIQPPVPGAHQAPRWNGQSWDLVPDWLGKIYWLPDGSRHTIETVGIAPPDNALDEALPPPLGEVRKNALRAVDTAAEKARLTFITPGDGQAMTYAQKEAEADALLADASPDAASYPFLAACLGVDGDTLADVAAVVRARRDAWRTIGADIERRRLLAKQTVSTATTLTEIETTLSTLTWPEPE